MSAPDKENGASGPMRLVEAAASGNLTEVKNLLQKYPEKINITLGGCTALHQAALNGHKHIIRYLQQHGADVDIVDAADNTPLHYAVQGNQHAVVSQLLDMKANMHLENNDGNTASQISINKSYSECVRVFQAKDKTFQASDSRSRFKCAAQFGRQEKCVSCGEMEACVTLEPCGHQIVCFVCSVQVRECRRCHSEVKRLSYAPDSPPVKAVAEKLCSLRSQNASLKKRLKEKICNICEEKDKDCVLLECRHVFCSQCVENLKREAQEGTCPNCRKPFKEFMKIYM